MAVWLEQGVEGADAEVGELLRLGVEVGAQGAGGQVGGEVGEALIVGVAVGAQVDMVGS